MVKFRETNPQRVPRLRGNSGTTIGVSQNTGPEKRRGVRVNSHVPLAIEWTVGGERRREEAQTRVVGPYGCLVVLPQNLEVDQHVQVTNLVSSQSNPGVIVSRGHERAEGWELGIRLINPQMDFWGLDL